MSDDLLRDLPKDLPSFIKRFGTDEQCRYDLVQARWPNGFRCSGCDHDRAYSHHKRLIEECAKCGKQHSILAGTIFEQTKTGLVRWFLAIYLVTSSKGGISAKELQRQMGFRCYQTAWCWLHKIRRAMIRPDRKPLKGHVEVDEAFVGAAKSGQRGRGAEGKRQIAGAVEAAPGLGSKRKLGRLRMQTIDDASAASLEQFLSSQTDQTAIITTDGWSGYKGLTAKGYSHQAIPVSSSWGEASLRLPAIHLVFGLTKRWLLGTQHGAVRTKHLQRYLDEYVFRFNRRTAKSISYGFARLVQYAVKTKPATYRNIVAASTA